MKLDRKSPTKIVVTSEKPIFVLGDESTFCVAEQRIKSFNVYYHSPKEKGEGK